MREQAIKLYDQAQADYPALKAQIEAQVVRWFWAAGGVGLFSLEPFYFEQNRFPKSKILKEDWVSLGIPSTDDFVVVVSDIKDSFLKKV